MNVLERFRRNSEINVVAVPSQAKTSSADAESGLFGVAVDWLSLVKFVGILGQLALLLIVMRQFQIESNAFLRVAALAFGGFVVHHWLPMRFRLPFFAMLSIASIILVFGIQSSAWLVGLGSLLIGICHLPVRFAVRIGLIVLATAGLVLFRIEWLEGPWSQAIWPILGSMFMFRIVLYLYDLRYEKVEVSAWRSFSYFFMLPNVCFPLFPVVDYKTFRRNYFDEDSYRIYQVGVEWIARGVVHLILYRVVYYYLTMSPTDIAGPADLARFIVANFLLYLRVSGQFHIIVGMLHLFGFNLLETHHRYFLASSFTDFWRRINIYWKDFMMKIFYYPIFFKLRGLGTTTALVIATLLVFVATWFLHAIQWFWLRGTFLLMETDIAFWGILGVLVVANSLYEAKFGRKRVLSGAKQTVWPDLIKRVGATAGTFSVICILWSLWTSESIESWLSLWSWVGTSISSSALVAAGLAVGLIFFVFCIYRELANKSRSAAEFNFFKRSTVTGCLLFVLALGGMQGVYLQFGPQAANFVNSLRSGSLSRADVAMLEKGYYESLQRVERFNGQLWELYMKRPKSWLDVQGSGLGRFTGDFLQSELMPSFVSFTSHGTIRTNRWGMRDREYEKQRPAKTYRIALLGASTVMGWGVGDDQTFESLLETRLNQQPGAGAERYEILNFAVPGYQPLQQVPVLSKAFEFQPNALFFVATGREGSRATAYLAEVVQKRIPIPYSELRSLVSRAGITPEMSETLILRRLIPFRRELLAWIYRRVVDESNSRNILPLFIFLPQVREGNWVEETPEILATASEAGFAIIDLSDVYKKHDVNSVRLAEWDEHPNSLGHWLIAERLYEELKSERVRGFFDAQLVSKAAKN
jgi:D-alanyl-lipoteichoic acid acyltransferase DltB (MBOAT superfamily)